ARAIESDQFDTGGLGLFGNALAHQRGSGGVAALAALAGQLRTHFGFQRRSADQHAIAFRRNDVGVDVQVRAENREAMNAQLGDLPAGRNRTTQTGNFFVHDSSLRAPLFLLGLFDDDAFVRIAHALALVGFGFAIGADFSGHLTDDLLVGALDDDFRLGGALGLHAGGQLVHDVVRKTELQLDGVALDLGAIAHANQVQLALEA